MKSIEQVIADVHAGVWHPTAGYLRLGHERANKIVEAINAAEYVIVPKSMWFRPDDDKPSDVQ